LRGIALVIYGWTALALSSSRLALRASTNVMEVQKDGRGSSKAAVRHSINHLATDFRFPHSTRARADTSSKVPNTAHRIFTWPSYTKLHFEPFDNFARFCWIVHDSYNFSDAPNVAHLVCDKECYETLEL
jgi:hypothetical protein